MNFNDSGIFGFDISVWQGAVNFTTMKNYGASFVIIRAGQGNFIDKEFVANWNGAKAAGIPRAAYWFYDPRYSPQAQASMFCSAVKADPPEGRLWLDIEFPTSWGGSYGAWQNWLTCLWEIQRLSGLRVGIYTGYYYWMGSGITDFPAFANFPLWLAWYTNLPASVMIPRPWSSCVQWQSGTPAVGYAAGVQSAEIDYDHWNSNFDFAAEYGGGGSPPLPPPPPIPTQDKTMINGTVNTTVKVFTDPTSNSPQLGTLLKGTAITAEKNNGTWLRLLTPKLGWANARVGEGMTGGDITWRVITTPPPPPPPDPDVSVPFTLVVDGFLPFTGTLVPL